MRRRPPPFRALHPRSTSALLLTCEHASRRLPPEIRARGDRARAEELIAKYVDGDVVPIELITERIQRHPDQTFVYALDR